MAAISPARHDPDLIASLVNLASYLASLGRRTEALLAMAEAKLIRSRRA
ncbi:hypothetical protein [Kitasatospora sp. NPDC059571]